MNPKDIQRFMNKVKIVGSCWEWQGAKDTSGYGQFRNKKLIMAHRFSWDYFIAQSVIIFFDIIVDALFEGLDVLIVDLLIGRWILLVNPFDPVFVDINLPQQAFLEILFIPSGKDHGIEDLP